MELTSNKLSALLSDKIQYFESKYDKILKADFDEDYAKNVELYSKKKVKKRLLNRLSGYKYQVLAFMYDFDIPFDNN